MIEATISRSLALSSVPGALASQIRARVTVPNPAYRDAVRMGRWTGNISRHLRFYKEEGGCLILPRGFAGELQRMCQANGVPLDVDDQRRVLPEVSFTFSGRLRPYQEQAVKDILSRDTGVLQAPTGSGKTTMALAVIAARMQPALVICHTKELMNQWRERASAFLGLSEDQIGQIGNGRKRIGGKLTVAIINSIHPHVERLREHFGHVIVDECHHCPSRTFTEAVTSFDCRFLLGLSATPTRRDQIPVELFLGDVVHRIESADLQASGDILKPTVTWRETRYWTALDASAEYPRVLSELTQHADRNRQIIADVVEMSRNEAGTCLVLSDRKEHVRTLCAMLQTAGISACTLTGDMTAKGRQRVVEDLNEGKLKVVCATGQLVGEGFDCRELSTLFVVTPLKFSGRVLQYAGRILRPSPGKQARIIDYVDAHVGVLKSSARARAGVYATI